MSLWGPNWEQSLRSRLKVLNHSSAFDFVMAEPDAAFGELFRRLRELEPQEPIALVQFQSLFFRDAQAQAELDQAVASTLYRRIASAFPKGWGVGPQLQRRRLNLFANWELPYDMSGFDKFAIDIAEWFANAPIDSVWTPRDHFDPILVDAIKIAWPATGELPEREA